MDVKHLIYTMMIIVQITALSRFVYEAKACSWSKQARWIAWRTGGVLAAVLLLTIYFFCGAVYDDILMEFIIITGLAAMTVLLISKVPVIINGMSDAEVGEELNIHDNTDEETNE